MTKPRARPVYTSELAHEICRRLTEGDTLREICKGDVMPAESTVRLWVVDDLNGFAAHYARARLVGYHTMADELITIADNPEIEAAAVNRDRLKVDTRKWLLSKALPKIYGDRIAADIKTETVADDAPPQTALQLAREIAFALHVGIRQAKAEAEQGAG